MGQIMSSCKQTSFYYLTYNFNLTNNHLYLLDSTNHGLQSVSSLSVILPAVCYTSIL